MEPVVEFFTDSTMVLDFSNCNSREKTVILPKAIHIFLIPNNDS